MTFSAGTSGKHYSYCLEIVRSNPDGAAAFYGEESNNGQALMVGKKAKLSCTTQVFIDFCHIDLL